MVNMTDNEASVIDEGAFSVRRSISIDAPIEKVWRAITEPEHISRWFGQTVLDGTGVGAAGTMTFEGYGTIPIRVEAIDEPRSVTYRWSNDDAVRRAGLEDDEARSTVFTFTLDEIAGGTSLTVVETGFDRTTDPAANMADHAVGWVSELDKLVALLEGDA
ncbi:SRPBCC domain-containing protein [Agromyces soli]